MRTFPAPSDKVAMTEPAEADIRVMLVDDQELVRSGFRMMIDSEDGITVVAEATNGHDAVEAVRTMAVDVILMDVRMPVMDGVEATRQITEIAPNARIVILTTFDLDEYVYTALRAGASGFLLKDARSTELIDAIRNAARGDAVVSPKITRRLLEHFIPLSPDQQTVSPRDARLDLLTEREVDVLRELAKGLTNSEIASRLVMAEGTVKTHLSRLMFKLQARDRVNLVLIGREMGFH
jgi:DNA-binding NarL/FixJ family response regulator